ncbi:hypothetical protein [Streptomyces sp. NBC_00083]|uniref:hypothetical protein n=1 Tax=Streptomyces sp. NBC_00083 TaxID=2975647 RepID=UPI002257E624|nr:hypothetical protein [Streptomyces sp. NBC_00083]MCX5383183.1 hypothetical protein [Streptomyces sp. NBC_00083]
MIIHTDATEQAREAARNNAAWCAALCRAHGITGLAGPRAWTSPRRTPLYYPDAVTLTPGASPQDIVGHIDLTAPGASVKDSFAALDLTAQGFDVLFDAQWIHHPAPGAADGNWQRVVDPDELAAWERAWSDGGSAGLFPPALLADPDHTFLVDRDERGAVRAGAVATRSGEVVGISNLYAVEKDPEAAWAGCLATVARLWPGREVVGYESGEDLAAALRAGFAPAGPLRVWRHRS